MRAWWVATAPLRSHCVIRVCCVKDGCRLRPLDRLCVCHRPPLPPPSSPPFCCAARGMPLRDLITAQANQLTRGTSQVGRAVPPLELQPQRLCSVALAVAVSGLVCFAADVTLCPPPRVCVCVRVRAYAVCARVCRVCVARVPFACLRVRVRACCRACWALWTRRPRTTRLWGAG